MLLDKKHTYSILLRAIVLLLRFCILFVLAKFLDKSLVGYYGIFTSTIAYALMYVGLDFYIFTTREILQAPTKDRGWMLKSQAALAGIVYLTLIPIAWILFYKLGWPRYLILWFFPILILEYLNQEIYRLLIVLSEQEIASFILFIRQGSWIIVAIILMNYNIININLDIIMILWGTADLLAGTLGFWKLRRLHLGDWREPINWKWIMKGIAVSTTFLIGTLSIRAIQTIDRYWIQHINGIDTTSSYILFFGIANVLPAFLDASLFSFKYTEMIKFYNKGEYKLYRKEVQKTMIYTLVFSIIFIVSSSIAIQYVLKWIGNPIYIFKIYIYPWVLAATIVYTVGLVPHFALYARGCDRHIVVSHITALPVFVISTWILSYIYTDLAVPIGVFISLTLVCFWKTIAYLKMIRDDERNSLPKTSAQLE